MNKPNVGKLIKSAGAAMSKHSPEILTGLGIAGMITTTVLAVRATPKALQLVEEEVGRRYDESDGEEVEFTKVDWVKTAWKPYIPTAVTGVLSVACLVGASSVNARRNAALAAAYTLSDTALRDYREKVIETLGEEKDQVVREKVHQKQIDKTPVTTNEVMITNKGETLCLDPLSQRYFKSDIDAIQKAENELNRQMLHGVYGAVSINEFYDELGLDHTEVGDDLGWNTDNLIKLEISSGITNDGKPCLVIGHYNAPRWNY